MLGMKGSHELSAICALVVDIAPPHNVRPPPDDEDDEGDILSDMMKRRYISEAVNPLPPSIRVFHPAFAAFAVMCRDGDLPVPEDFLRSTAKLMLVGCRVFPNQTAFQNEILRLLSDLLGGQVQQSYVCRTFPGYVVPASVFPPFSGTAALAAIGVDTETESGELHSTSSYVDHWCHANQRTLLNSCRVPSFVVGVSGPRVSISGAIISGKPVVQRLTRDLWLSHDHQADEAELLENARVLYALTLALTGLRGFYARLPLPTTEASRFFPSATRYRAPSGRPMTFTYSAVLKDPGEGSTVFRARLDGPEPQDVVVKFVERYGAAAHTLLASAGLAPGLLYCGDIWPEEDPPYDGHQMVVDRALKILHEKGMVHGDVRPLNVLLLRGWEEGVEGRVRLIDFDWAGRVGEARYPSHLSKRVFPVEGVQDFAPITPAHDAGMLGLLYHGTHRP
ncbi:uncharacterized protein BXZ73DRAFT_88259 [Epithele typhae]|uniref:uncharacterized protein n=1 Tax=Epithele typhae TaxID=378194 RepID=UPI00200859E8|nr:uncharacterized protein BXZ73DRAFT_88259 [Epithele typhae]KAH9941866.1 hypothetical protein BXZ73DRAFT_88259 [Epithele typhae]